MKYFDDPNREWCTNQVFPIIQELYRCANPSDYLASLPSWKRDLYFVEVALTCIINGGEDSYLDGPYGDDVSSLVGVLERIGSKGLLSRIRSLIDLFPNKIVPINYDERIACMDEIRRSKGKKRISEMLMGDIDDDIYTLMRKLDDRK